MTINSRAKGARFERWVANWLKGFGLNARRGQQFSGGPDSPDVVGWPGVHIEAKAVERLNIDQAMSQAVGDAGTNLPLVIHKRNRGPVMVTYRLEDTERMGAAIATLVGRAVYPEEQGVCDDL